MPGGVGTTPIRSPRPQTVVVPSQQRPESPLSSLLDYEDDDDIIGPQPANANTNANANATASSSRLAQGPSEQKPEPPTGPVTPYRQIQIPAYDPGEQDPASDAEDDLLEALVASKSTKPEPPSSPSPKPNTRSTAAAAAAASAAAAAASKSLDNAPQREKRRRTDEDDDDELLERLAAKSKRANSAGVDEQDTLVVPTTKPTSASATTTATATSKPTEEGPKKFKVKIGVSKGKFGGAPQPPLSRTGAKDGDGG